MHSISHIQAIQRSCNKIIGNHFEKFQKLTNHVFTFFLTQNAGGGIENDIFREKELYHVTSHVKTHGKIPGKKEKMKITEK